MKKQSNLFCPLHGTRLKNEKYLGHEGGITHISKAICKHDGCKHDVFIEDRQAYEQEGIITIMLT